jgi:hypothetical protein
MSVRSVAIQQCRFLVPLPCSRRVGRQCLIAGCMLFGLGVGNLVSLPSLIAQTEFESADVPRVVALVVAINQGVFAFAPAALGVMRDVTGSGLAPILTVGLIQVVGGLMVLSGSRWVLALVTPRGTLRS